MGKLLVFWGLIFVGMSNGYEYDEYFNGTEEVFVQDSVFGVSAKYNPLTVALTVIRGAGAQGAGTPSSTVCVCVYVCVKIFLFTPNIINANGIIILL